MSGLLVKSTAVMKDNLEELQKQGIDIPVLLGGAALTKGFINDYCRPIYDGPIFYCRDAFDGVVSMQRIEEGDLENTALAADLIEEVDTSKKVEKEFISMSSMKKWILEEDIGKMCAFLISDDSSKVSGQVISVDGHTERND